MEENKFVEFKPHFIEERPWGKFENLLEEDYCKVKKITVKPHQKLSYQYHHKRQEQWTIVQGSAIIVLNDERIEKQTGESIYIPLGAKHRIMNETDEDMIFIEVQTGTYFGEDDIVRINDEYGRE